MQHAWEKCLQPFHQETWRDQNWNDLGLDLRINLNGSWRKKMCVNFIWQVLKGSNEPWIPYKMDTCMGNCMNVGYWGTLFHGIRYMVQQLKQSEWGPIIKQEIYHSQCHVSECRQTPIQHHRLFTEVCGNKWKYCTRVMEFLFTDFHVNYITVYCQGFDYNSVSLIL